jgi:predicted DNA-binding protein with PD1-like motif
MKACKLPQGQQHLLILQKGDVVHDTVISWCEQNGVAAAWFSGIGAVRDIEMGYYDLELKQYFFTHYHDDHEVVSLTGNIMLVDGKPFAHIHTVLSNTTNAALGGHVNKAVVAVTLEVTITVYDVQIHRALDHEIGLKLCAL